MPGAAPSAQVPAPTRAASKSAPTSETASQLRALRADQPRRADHRRADCCWAVLHTAHLHTDRCRVPARARDVPDGPKVVALGSDTRPVPVVQRVAGGAVVAAAGWAAWPARSGPRRPCWARCGRGQPLPPGLRRSETGRSSAGRLASAAPASRYPGPNGIRWARPWPTAPKERVMRECRSASSVPLAVLAPGWTTPAARRPRTTCPSRRRLPIGLRRYAGSVRWRLFRGTVFRWSLCRPRRSLPRRSARVDPQGPHSEMGPRPEPVQPRRYPRLSCRSAVRCQIPWPRIGLQVHRRSMSCPPRSTHLRSRKPRSGALPVGKAAGERSFR